MLRLQAGFVAQVREAKQYQQSDQRAEDGSQAPGIAPAPSAAMPTAPAKTKTKNQNITVSILCPFGDVGGITGKIEIGWV
jgi:hypothetical protein